MPVLPAPDPTRDQPAWRAAALALLPDPLLRRALLLAARQRGARPERPHVELLCALVRAGRGSLDLPGGRGAILGGILRFQIGNARASSRVAPAGPPALTIPGPGRYAWEALRLEVFAPADSGARPAALACTVDLERAPFPWTLRAHRPGDRFRPARGHLKKVSELWIDAKLPRARRATLPLLADASGALFWVAGLRPGAAALPPRTMSVSLRFETDGGPLFELPSAH